MKTSKFFFSTLIAASAMTATAYAETLDDAVVSVDSFTTDVLATLRIENNDANVSEGVFTTTAQTTTGSINNLTTNVKEGNIDRYTYSAIITVDASIFSNEGSGLLISGGASTSGAAYNGENLSGAWGTTYWNDSRNKSIAYSEDYARGEKITLGLVFSGNGSSGTTLYVLGTATDLIRDLKGSTEATAITLGAGVAYSNLYWFNTALSATDMQRSMSVVAGDVYRWTGTESSNVWNTADKNWESAGKSVAFEDGKAVLFDAGTGTKSVSVNSVISAGAVTIADDYTFSIASEASLSATSIAVDADKTATLNLAGDMTLSSAISGVGTIKKTGEGVLTYSGQINAGATLEINKGEATLSSGDRRFKGNLIVGADATVTATTTDMINYDANASSPLSVTVSGNLVLNNRWTVGTWTPVTIAGGTISGTGQTTTSNIALDYYQSGTIYATASGSKLDARVRARSGNTLTFDVNDGATLEVSKSMILNYWGNNDTATTLIKDGAGDLTLSATNSGNASLDISNGKVILKADNDFKSITIEENASLEIALGALSLSTAVANAGTISVSGGALSFSGLSTTSSFEGLGSGEQEVDFSYTIFTGSGSVSGLDVSKVSINGSDVTSLAEDLKTAFITRKIYNIEEGTVADIGIATASSVDFINVLGTLDLGKTTSASHTNVIGTGRVLMDASSVTDHSSTINLGTEFQGTLAFTGNFFLAGYTLGEEATIELSSASGTTNSAWGALGTGVLQKVVFASDYGLTLGYDLTFSNEVRANEGTTITTTSGWPSAGSRVTFENKAEFDGFVVSEGTSVVFEGVSSVDQLTVAGSVSLSNGASLTISGESSWSGTGGTNGTIIVGKNATLDVTNGALFSTDEHVASARLTVQGQLKVGNTNWSESGSFGKLQHKSDTISLDGGEIVYTQDDSANRSLNVTSNGGTITANSGTTISFAGNADGNAFIISGNGKLTFNAIGNIELKGGSYGIISGSGSVFKSGEGTLTLSGDNTYTGGTTISAGTLIAGSNSALGTNSVKISGGKLEVSSGVTVSNSITVVLGDTLESAVITGDGSLGGKITLDYAVSAENVALALATEETTKTYTLLSGNVGHTLTTDSFEIGTGWAAGWDVTSYVYDANTGVGTLTLGIPEPSAFGLLAGVGALALVASRRRRSRR